MVEKLFTVEQLLNGQIDRTFAFAEWSAQFGAGSE